MGQHGSGAPHGTLNHFLAETQRSRWEDVPAPLFKAYARYLGLDPERESELLWLAELAMRAPLPVPWTGHFDSQGQIFYYNSELRVSSWIHPLEHEHREVHRRIVEFRSIGVSRGDVGLGGLREELERLEAESAEAERDWSEHYWSEHTDRDGRSFFFNSQTRCSSWTDPRPAVRHRLLLRRRAVHFLLGRDRPDGYPDTFEPEAEADRPAWLEAYRPAKDSGGSKALSTLGHRSSSPTTTASIASDPWHAPKVLLVDCAAECPVCYDPLYRSRPSVLASGNGRRVCGHYYCYDCAQKLHRGCPLCRARGPSGGSCRAQALPDVERCPRQWFQMVDVDADGRLEQGEVVKALEAVLPLDAERLWQTLGAATSGQSAPSPASPTGTLHRCATEQGWWQEWGNGKDAADSCRGIGIEAFCTEGGMLQWIVENLGELKRLEEEGEPPVLGEDSLESWFKFWDSNDDGGLSRAELLRAMMKTLRVSGIERRRIGEIRETIERCFSAWAAKDTADSVSREEFLSKPDGLGELLLHALFPAAPSAISALCAEPAPPAAIPKALPEEPPPSFRRSASSILERKLSTLRHLSETKGRWTETARL